MSGLAAPRVAHAQSIQAPREIVLATFAAVIFTIVAVTVTTYAVARSRRRAAADHRRIRELFGTLARTTAVLDATPTGFFEWSAASGLETCSSGLAAAVGTSPVAVKTFRDLAASFVPEDFEELEARANALRTDRTEFHQSVRAANGRVLEALGRAILAIGTGEPLAYTVWFHDATGLARDLADSMAAAEVAVTQRDQWHEMLDAAPFPIWRRGADLDIVWVNRAYATALESDPDTVVNDGIEFAPGSGPQQSRSLAAMARQTGAAQTDTRRFNVRGERRVFVLTEAPLSDGGAVGFARDVTEREEAWTDLRRHTEAHASVMDRLNSVIAIFGPDRKLRFFNEAYARLWRLDEDWLASAPAHVEILERLREARTIPEQADFRAYKAEMLERYASVLQPEEEVQYLPDGRALRVVTAPHPFGGLLFIYEDVSDRLELERARNTLAAVQRATLDHLFEAVAVFGGDGRLKLFNKRFARIWDLDEAFLHSEPHVADLAERCRGRFRAGAGGWLATKEKIVSRTLDRTGREARLVLSDGTQLQYASRPLPDGNTLYTYLDVSEDAAGFAPLGEGTNAAPATAE